jgi:WD40 repeat protein
MSRFAELINFDFIEGKLDALGVESLLADYDRALDSDIFLSEDLAKTLKSIAEAIRLSADILKKDKSQLVGQLFGRLLDFDSPEIRAMLEAAKENQNRPRLRPLTSSLSPPGGPLLRSFGSHTNTQALAVTADGTRAISSARDGSIKVWEVETGAELLAIANENAGVSAIAVTPDGKRGISGHFYSATVKVWDLEIGSELYSLKGHKSSVDAVAITPDGKLGISTSKRTLKVWNLETGSELFTFKGYVWMVNAVAAIADGTKAISAESDNNVLQVWNLKTAAELFDLSLPESSWKQPPAGNSQPIALVGFAGGSLKAWDLTTATELYSLKGHPCRGSDYWPVDAIAFKPDGKRAVSAGNWTIKVWDLETTKELVTLPRGEYPTALTPDGRIAIAADYREFQVWDLQIAEVAFEEKGHTSWSSALPNAAFPRKVGHIWEVTDLAVTPDGKKAISCSGNETVGLAIWNLETLEEVFSIATRTHVYAIAATPDSKKAIAGFYYGPISVWCLETGEELFTLPGHPDEHSVYVLAAMPDGKRVISGADDNTIKVWDLETRSELCTLEGHTHEVHGLALMPDGRRVISASWDKTLKMWDLETGTELFALEGHSSLVSTVAVTPDGKQALSGSSDGTVKIWDLETGTELFTLETHTRWIKVVAVTPDGKRAILVLENVLKVWDLENRKAIATFTAEGSLISCTLAPDGVTVVAGEMNGRVHFLTMEGV